MGHFFICHWRLGVDSWDERFKLLWDVYLLDGEADGDGDADGTESRQVSG